MDSHVKADERKSDENANKYEKLEDKLNIQIKPKNILKLSYD